MQFPEIVFKQMLDGVCVTDLHGNIRDVNPAFIDITQRDKASLIGSSFHDFTPPEYFAAEQRMIIKQVYERGYSDPYEKEYELADGSRVPIEVTAYLIRDEAGEPVGMFGTVRDLRRCESPIKLSEH